jgi:outer membrane protein assembly factor BamB
MSEMIKLMKRFGKILFACNSLLLLFSISVPDHAFAQEEESSSSSPNEFLTDSPILNLEYLSEENLAVLAVDEGAIYKSGRLIGLDLNTGIPRWEIEKIDWTKASSFFNDTVVIISEGDYSTGYNLINGETLWESATPIYGVSWPLQIGFYYESYPPQFFLVKALNGEIFWYEKVRRLKGLIPVQMIDDRYLAVFQNKGFRLYDLKTSMYWECRSKKKSNREFKSFGYAEGSFSSSDSLCNSDALMPMSNLIHYNGDWYYAGNSSIVKFDSNGVEAWSFELPNNLKGQILLFGYENGLYFVNRIEEQDLFSDQNAFAIGSLDMQTGEEKGILFYSEIEFLTDIEFVGDSLYVLTSREILLADISGDIQLMNRNKSLIDNLIGKPVAISQAGFKKTSEGFEPLSSGSIYMEDEFGGRLQLSDSSSYAIVDNRDIYTISSCTESAKLFSNLKEFWLTDQNNRLTLKKAVSNRAVLSDCYLFEIEGNSLIYRNICR